MKKFLPLMLFCSSIYANGPIRPIESMTPGDVDPKATIEKLCTPGYSRSTRHVSKKKKDDIYRSYGINPKQDVYEIDHLIPLSLGGSNDKKNLWPESYTTSPFNAHKKDALEDKMHKMVCEDKITLDQARRVLVEDWVKGYHDYIMQH